MKGGIYSDQKCPLCGKKFVDNHRNGLQCTQHPEQKAASFKVNFPIGENEKLTRRFKNYQEASRLLNFIRAQVDKGIFVSMYSQNLRKLLTS